MILESDIENAAVSYAENQYTAYIRKLQYVGRQGAPDRMFYFPNGEILFLEFKRPGGIRRANQIREISKMRVCGIEAYFVSSLPEARERIDHAACY